MVNNLIRTGIGILASGVSFMLYGGPIVTFWRIIKKRSTEDFSGVPYAIALFNCLIYTLYGSPLVSDGWKNIVVMVVNSIGLVLECAFIGIFLTFAQPKIRVLTARMVVGVLMVFGTITGVCFLAMHDKKHKQVLVGTAGMVATVVLYGAPLSVIRLVLKTKSVEYMPFNLSLCTFVTSVLWLGYGALSKDIMIMAPNFLGLPLGSFQMVLHCMYKGNKGQTKDKTGNHGNLDLGDNISTEEKCDNEKSDCPDEHDLEMQVQLNDGVSDRPSVK
uniref:Bidirectional sugar transporter SWEET n=1 Tax=Araucaria cunninghamii TaxID=56994 RepID=A0A0D6QW49_ARACU